MGKLDDTVMVSCDEHQISNQETETSNQSTQSSEHKSIISKDKFRDEYFDHLVEETSKRISSLSGRDSDWDPNTINDGESSSGSQEAAQARAASPDSSLEVQFNRLNQPKRPMNAFMVWGQAIRRELHQKFSNVQNAMLSKALGRVWKTLEAKEKEPYVAKANKIKANHKLAYPNYRYQPRRIQERRIKNNLLVGLGHLNYHHHHHHHISHRSWIGGIISKHKSTTSGGCLNSSNSQFLVAPGGQSSSSPLSSSSSSQYYPQGGNQLRYSSEFLSEQSFESSESCVFPNEQQVASISPSDQASKRIIHHKPQDSIATNLVQQSASRNFNLDNTSNYWPPAAGPHQSMQQQRLNSNNSYQEYAIGKAIVTPNVDVNFESYTSSCHQHQQHYAPIYYEPMVASNHNHHHHHQQQAYTSIDINNSQQMQQVVEYPFNINPKLDELYTYNTQ